MVFSLKTKASEVSKYTNACKVELMTLEVFPLSIIQSLALYR